jgi:membrane protein
MSSDSSRRDGDIDLREGDRSGEPGRGRDATRPREVPKEGWKDVLVRVKDQVRSDNVVLLSAGVAFFALLALIPALVATVSIYGLFADPEDVQRQINDVAGGLPDEARELLEAQLSTIVDTSAAGLSIGAIVGVLGALWGASAGVKHLISAINVAYNEEETRGFLKLRGLALVITIAAILASVVALGLIAVVPAVLADTALGDGARWAINLGRWPLLFLGYMVALAALYRYAPDRDNPQWRWVSWGAVVATVLWVLGSVGFSIYSANFGDFNETYGSLAAVIVLMLWLMLTAFTVILGAEFNSELEHQTAEDTTDDAPEPMGQRNAVMADNVGRRS